MYGNQELGSGAMGVRQGNILVADTYNSRIRVLSPSGQPVDSWGESKGNGPGQFDHPSDVAIDHQGTVFVADSRNARVQRLSPLGQVLGIWQRGVHGTELECPVGVAVDGEGNVYVADSATVPRIVKLSPWGAWIESWALPEVAGGGYVQGLAVDAACSLYVTAYSTQNQPLVVKLSPRGEVVAVWK